MKLYKSFDALKKSAFFLSILIFSLLQNLVFAQNDSRLSEVVESIEAIHVEGIPESLNGIWQNSERVLLFTDLQNTKQNAQTSLMLKTLYGWYYDRTAEPEFPPEINAPERDLNNVTGSTAENPKVTFAELVKPSAEEGEGAWEISMNYADKTVSKIPVAKIKNELYLNFFVKQSYGSEVFETETANLLPAETPLQGAWLGVGSATGICVSPVNNSKELTSLYISEDTVYIIRYWQTDMEFSDKLASFSDGDKTFYIAKHIKSAGKIYTCVTGRSLQIRNVTRTPLKDQKFLLNTAGNVLTIGKSYLTLLDSTKNSSQNSNLAEYFNLAKTANSRRKPDPPPLLPIKELDWHWKEINYLEKDNKQIQEVRKRQREFARQSQNSSFTAQE